MIYILSDLMQYFNSRTHVECDLQVAVNRRFANISTHALTWSATG